jgi:hypothetical protein
MKACAHCPFRTDRQPFPLGRSRRREIANDILRDGNFGCHETTTFDDDGVYVFTPKERPCNGAVRLIEAVHGDCAANLSFRLAIKSGRLDRRKIDRSTPTCQTAEQFISMED